MPTISNASVVSATGLTTQDGGGRKLIRIAKGWLISAVVNSSGSVSFYKSEDNGFTWVRLCRIDSTYIKSVAVVSKGNRVHVLCEHSYSSIYLYTFDASTISDISLGSTYSRLIDSSQDLIGEITLAINENGNELCAAWSSSNSTYSASYNIRYAKIIYDPSGAILNDGARQLTTENTTLRHFRNPSILFNGNNQPVIITDYNTNAGTCGLWSYCFDGTTWTANNIFSGVYQVASSSSLYVPQRINGLANGRIWSVYQASNNNGKFNVFVNYSDNGGSTWSTSFALTSGTTYDRLNATITSDKTGKVFVIYEDHQESANINLKMRSWSSSWETELILASASTAERYPSALVDFSLKMTTPPIIYTDTTNGIRFLGSFPVPSTIFPASKALGEKIDSSVLDYEVTPDSNATVTSITEKLNGITINTIVNPTTLSFTFKVPVWDSLKYYAKQTLSVTVVDSNGLETTQTYSFKKTLKTDSALYDSVNATQQAKENVGILRDEIAAKIGLPAGSSLEAISNRLSSGAYKRWDTGTVFTSTTQLNFTKYDGTTSSYYPVTVTGLDFLPRVIILYRNIQLKSAIPDVMFNSDRTDDKNRQIIAYFSNSSHTLLTGNAYVKFGSFQLPAYVFGDTQFLWFAFE